MAPYLTAAFAAEHLADWVLATTAVIGTLFALITLRQIVKQTRAAVTAADAGKVAAEIARDTLYLTASADVQVTSTTWEPHPQNLPELVEAPVTLHLKNFGNTAATDVILDFSFGVRGASPALDVLPKTPPFSVAAGQELQYGFKSLRHIVTDQNLLARVLGGTLPLNIWGTIEFTDVFKRRHRMLYTWTWIHPTSVFALTEHTASVEG